MPNLDQMKAPPKALSAVGLADRATAAIRGLEVAVEVIVSDPPTDSHAPSSRKAAAVFSASTRAIAAPIARPPPLPPLEVGLTDWPSTSWSRPRPLMPSSVVCEMLVLDPSG